MFQLICFLLSLLAITTSVEARYSDSHRRNLQKHASPFSSDDLAPYVLELTQRPRIPLHHAHEGHGKRAVASLRSLYNGQVFTTEIKIGPQSFQVGVDTGSSDLWVVKTMFECLEPGTQRAVPQKDCDLGTLYNPSRTLRPVLDQNFYLTFGGGEILYGSLGLEQVTFAGLTVKDQKIGIVDRAVYNGGGSSGILGLAFPSLTSAFAGNLFEGNDFTKQRPYNPFLTNVFNQGLTRPIFSLALEQGPGSKGGYLAIGGLPPVSFSADIASSPFYETVISDKNRRTRTGINFYAIKLSGLSYRGSEKFSQPEYSNPVVIVDSGTTATLLPKPVALAINALFDPPAFFAGANGGYIQTIDCSAKPPKVGIKIGEQTFYMDEKNMILRLNDKICFSGVQASRGRSQLNVLGVSFLKSVVAVFDIGASEMRFAARNSTKRTGQDLADAPLSTIESITDADEDWSFLPEDTLENEPNLDHTVEDWPLMPELTMENELDIDS